MHANWPNDDTHDKLRLFTGIQGDKDRQGELFGLKNIFALNEDLVTKGHIEEAHLSNLEWALANVEATNDSEAVRSKGRVKPLWY